MTDLRPIQPLPIADLTPQPAEAMGARPVIEWVRPEELYVEAKYQREIGARSMRLIRSMVEGWSWSKFKLPACSLLEDGRRVVIDGQHTAIGAACHPLIDQIPVLVTRTGSIGERAEAFVGHNRNRIAITALQIHRAGVAAGDELANAVEDACRLAGVTVLQVTRPRGEWRPGETIAIQAITSAVSHKGRSGGARILKILVRARQMPITALLVKATFQILYQPEWAWKDDSALADIIASKTADQWEQHAAERRAVGQPTQRALAVEWYRLLQGRR
ncbi:hypothetical protein [Devosia sp.]|uniref:hypothetical protein n=1 Tax=Devosia sp. TaxID=1871048 RepID=UPI002F0AD063